jgi:hypothetical protein
MTERFFSSLCSKARFVIKGDFGHIRLGQNCACREISKYQIYESFRHIMGQSSEIIIK